MFLFIFESIGTSELVLIAIVALIFLGPRKMPEYAKKIGKLMADFRATTNEFKQTWEREVNFDEEAKAFRIEDDAPAPVGRVNSILDTPKTEELAAPSVKEIDPARFKTGKSASGPAQVTAPTEDELNDKKNWL